MSSNRYKKNISIVEILENDTPRSDNRNVRKIKRSDNGSYTVHFTRMVYRDRIDATR